MNDSWLLNVWVFLQRVKLSVYDAPMFGGIVQLSWVPWLNTKGLTQVILVELDDKSLVFIEWMALKLMTIMIDRVLPRCEDYGFAINQISIETELTTQLNDSTWCRKWSDSRTNVSYRESVNW